jgi:hypothetical protein
MEYIVSMLRELREVDHHTIQLLARQFEALEGEGNGDGVLTPDDFPDSVELKRTILVVDREIASVRLEVVPRDTAKDDTIDDEDPYSNQNPYSMDSHRRECNPSDPSGYSTIPHALCSSTIPHALCSV